MDTNVPLDVLEGAAGTITNSHLLCIDAESPPSQITFTIAPDPGGSAPVHGTLLLSGSPLGVLSTFTQDDVNNNRLTYQHDGSETTADEFQFGAQDGNGEPASDNGFTVFSFHINITLQNDPPTLFDHKYGLGIGATLHGTLQATDPDSPTLTFRVETNGTKGDAVIDDATLGTFTYTPHPGESGTDVFTFQANDGQTDATAPGTITINIENQPPTALPGSATTTEGNATGGGLQATDPDLPPQTLSFSIATNGTKGTATVTNSATGAYTYVPAAGLFGQDSFTFQVSDGFLTSAPATISVTIRPFLEEGDLLVTDTRAKCLFLIDPALGQIMAIASGANFPNPRGLDVDASRKVDVASPGSGVIRVEPISGVDNVVSPGSNFSTDPLGVFGLAIEPDGHIVVGDGVNGVVRVDPVTGATSTVTSGGNLNLVLDVIVAPNGDIYATDASIFLGGPSKVVKVDPTNGAQTVVSSGGNLVLPAGIALEAGGTLVVADASSYAGAPADQLIRIDPIGGVQAIVTSGGLMRAPTGIALASNGDILLANQAAANLLRVDPISGTQSVLFADPLLQQPFCIHAVTAAALGVNDGKVPQALELAPCWPNPAGALARFDYAIPRESHVRLRVYDVGGRVVANLVDRVQPSGRFSATLDTRSLAAGVYFYRLEAGRLQATKRLVIAR